MENRMSNAKAKYRTRLGKRKRIGHFTVCTLKTYFQNYLLQLILLNYAKMVWRTTIKGRKRVRERDRARVLSSSIWTALYVSFECFYMEHAPFNTFDGNGNRGKTKVPNRKKGGKKNERKCLWLWAHVPCSCSCSMGIPCEWQFMVAKPIHATRWVTYNMLFCA